MKHMPLTETQHFNSLNQEINSLTAETVALGWLLRQNDNLTLTRLFLAQMQENIEIMKITKEEYILFDAYTEMYKALGMSKSEMFVLAKINRDTFYKRVARLEPINDHISKIKAAYEQHKIKIQALAV